MKVCQTTVIASAYWHIHFYIVGLIEQQVTLISLVSSSTLSRISRPSLDICRLWRCMEVLRCYWTHLWISKRSVPGRFTRRKMALLWWKYVSLLAIAMPLWLVLLQVRIKSSPTNVSHQHRFDETMPDRNNTMKNESPDAKQRGLIMILFPRTYPNHILLVRMTMTSWVRH